MRPFALFGEMESNPICIDRAMRNAADSLRVDRTGWIQAAAPAPEMNSRRSMDDPSAFVYSRS
jgi:hypothetical protein